MPEVVKVVDEVCVQGVVQRSRNQSQHLRPVHGRTVALRVCNVLNSWAIFGNGSSECHHTCSQHATPRQSASAPAPQSHAREGPQRTHDGEAVEHRKRGCQVAHEDRCDDTKSTNVHSVSVHGLQCAEKPKQPAWRCTTRSQPNHSCHIRPQATPARTARSQCDAPTPLKRGKASPTLEQRRKAQ